LVGTLEACGVIRRERVAHRYALSAQVLQLANTFLRQSDLREIALPPMTALRDRVNETVGLHLKEGRSRIVIAQVGANREVRHMYRNVGEPIPLHLGAAGKVMLAFQPASEIAAFLAEEPLVAMTPRSITDPEVLRRNLEVIARQGYAVTWEERSAGVVAIAAPVFDSSGAVIAAVNVSGPSQRIRRSDVSALIPQVVATAQAISRELGHGIPISLGREAGSPSGATSRSASR
jgi:IclR family acetate operon transcriptional repressor